jgi:hypothetical protein
VIIPFLKNSDEEARGGRGSRGRKALHWCQFKKNWAVETAATQTKPAYAGFKNLGFSSVRAGGLGLFSCDF